MGDIFTQSRSLAGPPMVVHPQVARASAPNTWFNIGDTLIPDVHTQSTTSFRSGRGWNDGDDARLEREALDSHIYERSSVALASEYDTGHEFSTMRQRRILYQRADTKFTNFDPTSKETVRCTGPMLVNRSESLSPSDVSEFITVPPMSSNESKLWGGRAISATIPTKPQVNLSQTLGELWRDGLPSLLGLSALRDRTSLARSAGNEYLNLEFGWKPLVSDIKKLAKSLASTSVLLSQLERDSGRLVRRGFSFPADISTTETKWTLSHSGYTAIFGWNSVFETGVNADDAGTQVDRISTKYWFKGAYTYKLALGDSIQSKLRMYEQKANVLLGTRLTPATLWELAPWSWLVDWKIAIGTALSNAESFSEDGLVLKYGYLMRHTVADRTISVRPRLLYSGGYRPLTITNAYRTERKERVKATPYGFGLDPEAFSLKQWSILTALGFTRNGRIAK